MKKLIFLTLIVFIGFEANSYAVPAAPNPKPASQAEAEAGTETQLRSWSPARVAQAVAALAGEGATEVTDAIYSASDNGDTTHAISRNAFYDYLVNFDADADGSFTDELWYTVLQLQPVEGAFVDGDKTALDNSVAAIGVSGAANMGTYTGDTITDNQTTKQNLQELETALEAITSSSTLAGLTDVAGADYTEATILIGDGADSFDQQAISGDVTLAASGAVSIGNDKITEAMLKAVDSASDEDILTYETTTGDFEWQTIDAMVGTISAGALADDSVVENDLAAALAFDDGDYIDLSGITMTANTAEGLVLPTWANVAVTSNVKNGTAAWDETSVSLKIKSAAGWQSLGATAAPVDAEYLVLTLDGTLTAERSLAAGTGIGGADAGANDAYTLSFAPAELGNLTWGTGLAASQVWTFDVSGTDHTVTWGNGIATFGDAVTVTDTLTASGTLAANGTLAVATGQSITLGANTLNSGDLLDMTKVADADLGDIGTSSGVWAVEDDSHAHTSATITLASTDLSDTATIGYLAGANTWTGNNTFGNGATDLLTVLSVMRGSGRAVVIDDDTTISASYATASNELWVEGDIESGATIYAAGFVAVQAATGQKSFLLEGSANGTDFRGWRVPDSLDTGFNFQIPTGQPSANSVMLAAAPTGTGADAYSAISYATFSTDNFLVSGGSITIKDAGVSVAEINASGTPDGTTYLRGDGSWQAVSASSATAGGTAGVIQYNTAGSLDAEAAFKYVAASNTLQLTQNSTDPTIETGDGTYSWGHTPMVGIEGVLEVDGAAFFDGNVTVAGTLSATLALGDIAAQDGNNSFLIQPDDEDTDNLIIQARDIDAAGWDNIIVITNANTPTLALAADGGIAVNSAATFSATPIFSNATTALTVGAAAAGVDYAIAFAGETNQSTITYDEDNDRFVFGSDIQLPGSTVYLGATPIAALTIDVSDNVTVGDGNTNALYLVTNTYGGGGTIKYFIDANNADNRFEMGTSSNESFRINTLIGTSDKFLDEVQFVSSTEQEDANAGFFSFYIDGAHIVDINDQGITMQSAMNVQFSYAGTITQSANDQFNFSETSPTIMLQDTDDAAGTAAIYGISSGGANDIVMTIGVEDSAGNTAYAEIDGVTETVDILKPMTATSIAATGIITGLVNTSNDPANLTNFNGTATISAAGSTSLPLPTASAGKAACIRQGQGRTDTLTVTPASGDYIVKDGVRGTIATAITSSDANASACFVAYDADDWYMNYTGTWSE